MSKNEEFGRILILAFVFINICLLFVNSLITHQIVDGADYKARATSGSVTYRYLPAARGEIVDRYGSPLVINRVGYDIILDKSYLPVGGENEILITLIGIMEQLGESWNDNLPITLTEPFTFNGTDSAVASLKTDLGLGEFATAEECLYWMANSRFYNIVGKDDDGLAYDYDPVTVRKIAGIRYEMAQNSFSLKNVYTFAPDVSQVCRDTVMESSHILPGVDIMETPVREYIDSTIAPHILGLTGPLFKEDVDALTLSGQMYSDSNPSGYRNNDVIGRSGIEYSFESYLRGTSGEQLIVYDNNGNVIDQTDVTPPIAGGTVVLTIDKNLQVVAQDALASTIQMYNDDPYRTLDNGKFADAGVAIVQLVETGEILAMANYPTYDLAKYSTDFAELSAQKPEPLLNRATLGVYRPGSIFKCGVALAGLSEGLVTRYESIDCTHVYSRFTDIDFTCMYHHGNIDVITALQKSCNIYFYETGWRLGVDTMNNYMERLGLGVKTGIEIPEGLGRLSTPEYTQSLGDTWQPGNVIQSAIGQLDNAFTPVQLSSYVATIANDGARMQTHLVKAIKSFDFKDTIYETEVTTLDEQVGTDSALATVQAGMVAATAIGGTSYSAWEGFPLTVASKTGTPEGVGTLSSTYICYMPAENPEIAITIVLEKGGQGYTGAPIARLIAEAYFATDEQRQVVQPSLTLLP